MRDLVWVSRKRHQSSRVLPIKMEQVVDQEVRDDCFTVNAFGFLDVLKEEIL